MAEGKKRKEKGKRDKVSSEYWLWKGMGIEREMIERERGKKVKVEKYNFKGLNFKI